MAGAILYLIASGKAGFDVSAGFASNGYGDHSPGKYSLLAAIVCEIVMTMMFLNLASAGDEIVSAANIYGGAQNLMRKTFLQMGIKFHLVDADDPENFRRATNERTKAYFVETMGNPKGDVPDLEAIAKIAHEYGIPMIADNTEATTALHTATHLLQAALRKVLHDDGVAQKGSNITAERLRFDFSFPRKVTPEELIEVEKLVNEAIDADIPVSCEEMTVEEAKAAGAIGLFESKYGAKVKVYTVPGVSKEICGGPHVKHTGEMGRFKIKKEEASSAGVRRIKAVLIHE